MSKVPLMWRKKALAWENLVNFYVEESGQSFPSSSLDSRPGWRSHWVLEIGLEGDDGVSVVQWLRLHLLPIQRESGFDPG